MTQKWLNTCRIVVAAVVAANVAAAIVAVVAVDIAAVIDAIRLWLLRGRVVWNALVIVFQLQLNSLAGLYTL